MNDVWEWIKTHPVIVIGGIGLLVVFYMVYSSSSSGTSAVTVAGSTAPTDAEVNAAAAVQVAQLQQNAQSNQLSAQLAAQQNNNATAITIAQLQGTSANYQVEQAANVQELGITATRDVQLAGLTTQQIISQQQADVATHTADLSAEVQLAQAATYAQIASLNAASQVAQTEAWTTMQTKQFEYGAIASIVQSQANLKKSTISITTPDISVNAVNSKGPAGGGSSTAGIIGAIGGVLGSIFSDARMKRDVTLLYRLPSGIGVYRFRYYDNDNYYTGVIAQEVEQSHPTAVHTTHDGFKKVNYGALGLRMERVAA